jgi:aminopeptidase N
MWFGNLVTM